MYCLFTDETNTEYNESAKFFIYGGLFFNIDKFLILDEGIRKIREEAGYKISDKFKFDTSTRPASVSIENATKAKRDTIDLCLKNGYKFIAYVIHHGILSKSKAKKEQRYIFGANTVMGAFNRFLTDEAKDYGICYIDTLPIKGKWQYLSQKFTEGLPYASRSVPLDRIKLFSYTCNNASNLSSAMDIVLGSFRFCVNNPDKEERAKDMLYQVTQMMWHREEGNKVYLGGYGLILRPRNVIIPEYEKDYHTLIQRLTTWGNAPRSKAQ